MRALVSNVFDSRPIRWLLGCHRRVLAIAILLRIALLVYGRWQDVHLDVKYTDVDYRVFSDAALHVSRGESPFRRTTYRYTPLFAWLLVPNHYIHVDFGKWVFVACDLLAGLVLARLSAAACGEKRRTNALLSLWLLNPIVMNVSTRGNLDSVSALLVLGTILCVVERHIVAAALLHGLSVHVRVYPVFYSAAFVLWLNASHDDDTQRSALERLRELLWPPSWRARTLVFGLLSGTTFVALTALMAYWYGDEYVNEALLFHLRRRDVRHNFSVYHLGTYLSASVQSDAAVHGGLDALVSFVPQLGAVVALTVGLARENLHVCLFAVTVVFVAFNKVFTVQYFVWYFALLPVALVRTKLAWDSLVMLLGAWLAAQGVWLALAYRVEFLGKSVFVPLWLASLALFVVHLWLVVSIVRNSLPLIPAEREQRRQRRKEK